MTIELDFFVEVLNTERKPVRECAGFAYQAIRGQCEKALVTPQKVPKRYFAERARTVYREAKKTEQEDALRLCFGALFEQCAQFNEALIPPPLTLSVEQKITVINDDSPPLALIDTLEEMLEIELAKKHSGATRAMLLSLLLAKHSGIHSKQKLNTVLSADVGDITIFKDAQFAALTLKNDRVIFDAVALRAFTLLKSLPAQATKINSISAALSRVFQHYALERHLNMQMTLAEALEGLSFTTQSIAAESFSTLYTPLDGASFARAITGTGPAQSGTKTNQRAKRGRNKRTIKELVSLEKLTELFDEQSQRQLSFDARTQSADSELIHVVRKSVQAYEKTDKKQRRNSSAFSQLKKNLFDLLNVVYERSSEASFVAIAIATYITDLMLNGSNIKEKLAVSTIETYLSTLSVFARDTWSDEALLLQAQESHEALEELSEDVADALSELPDASKQSTVLVFLQYLYQTTRINLFDANEIEYLGAGACETRAHYILQQDFNETCDSFLSKANTPERRQCVIFAQLAYCAGLRRKEASLLETSDVSIELKALYVTRLIKRKTLKAVRRFPLFLLPLDLVERLESYIGERERIGRDTLFDDYVLSALNDEFIQALRAKCSNENLVFHSLRHSAANNLVFQLSFCCSSALKTYRESVFFLKSNSFSDNQLERIKRELKALGRPPNNFFATLDTVAQLLGHVSPVVTATSYLHLFDILFFMNNSLRTQSLSANSVASLLKGTNYRFEFKKRYEAAGDLHERNKMLFKAFSRGLPKARSHETREMIPAHVSQPSLTFSDYLNALTQYKTVFNVHLDQSLQKHLEECTASLEIDFLQDKLFTTKSWVSLVDTLSITTWNAKNTNAISTLSKTSRQTVIPRLREAERHLRALNLLGLSQSKVTLYMPDESQSEHAEKWTALIKKYGFTVLAITGEKKKHTSIASKPVSLRWPLWRYLPEIIRILTSYLNFQQNVSPKE
ncbi:tyrosine-type recombinase/integrase [Marinobacter sp.]|uniref:tyrosine-type recombinase/integrase n=1 Tax=Marinobacter sp. TaxID=50741 RepID=UPI0026250EA1|nr:tyrosine-type recombinase/integrase [Marinobacter sp.]